MDTLTRTVTARQLRAELASIVNQAAYARGRIGLDRYGQLVAVVIGIEDFQRLRRLEDEPGALHAEETLDELAARLMREDDGPVTSPTGRSVPQQGRQGQAE